MNSLQLRGYDQFFMDLVLDVDLAEKLMDKILWTLKEMWTHYMEAVGPYVQVAYVTDDFGTQKSMMVSPKMFRDLIKPRWKELVQHIKGLGDVKVSMHRFSGGAAARGRWPGPGNPGPASPRPAAGDWPPGRWPPGWAARRPPPRASAPACRGRGVLLC